LPEKNIGHFVVVMLPGVHNGDGKWTAHFFVHLLEARDFDKIGPCAGYNQDSGHYKKLDLFLKYKNDVH
jgi:hypothetical protein